MTPELEVIKDQLQTRNVIAWAVEARYSVNLVRVGKGQRVLMVCVNGKVDQEWLLTGEERSPELSEVYRLRKLFNCEGFENENV